MDDRANIERVLIPGETLIWYGRSRSFAPPGVTIMFGGLGLLGLLMTYGIVGDVWEVAPYSGRFWGVMAIGVFCLTLVLVPIVLTGVNNRLRYYAQTDLRLLEIKGLFYKSVQSLIIRSSTPIKVSTNLVNGQKGPLTLEMDQNELPKTFTAEMVNLDKLTGKQNETRPEKDVKFEPSRSAKNLSAFLEPGERLVWQGQPSRLRFYLSRTHSFMWLVIPVWIGMEFFQRPFEDFREMYLVDFGVLWPLVAVAVLGHSAYIFVQGMIMSCAVTDRRALVAFGTGGAFCWSYRADEIGMIKSSAVEAHARGTIILREGNYIVSTPTNIVPSQGLYGVYEMQGAMSSIMALMKS